MEAGELPPLKPVPVPEPPKEPTIRPPEAPKLHFDATSPEAGEWWKTRLHDTHLLDPYYGEVKPPPQSTFDFTQWVHETAHQHARKIKANPAEYGTRPHDPIEEASLLYDYAEALLDWHRAEGRGNGAQAAFYIGKTAAIQDVITHKNHSLLSDVEFVREAFLRLPLVEVKRYRARWNEIIGHDRSKGKPAEPPPSETVET